CSECFSVSSSSGSTVWHPGCKNTTRTEERHRERTRVCVSVCVCVCVCFSSQPTRSSSESICSRPGSSIPGSPGHTIYAKVDNEILDYRDLAAIPKVKAIYDIERPDLITYEPLYSTSLEERDERQESVGESSRNMSPTPPGEGSYDRRERILQRSTSQGSIGSPVYNRHGYIPTLSRSPQHFHRPEALTGMQKLCSSLCSNSVGSRNSDSRPTSPFRHHFLPHSQGTDPPSGRSSPLPLRPDSRPITPPLSLTPKHFHLPGRNIDRSVPMVTNLDMAAIARHSKAGDDIIRSATFPAAHAPSPDDSSRSEGDRWPCSLVVLGTTPDTSASRRKRLTSGLGKLILKEEMEKEQIRERHARSLSAQRYDPKQSNCDAGTESPPLHCMMLEHFIFLFTFMREKPH
uniref:Putative adherens-junction anchoring domain-containing protein n=1 Tax=Labrus bergylta TaxID=56723 RepID=A0A3Q3FHC5_9LABR